MARRGFFAELHHQSQRAARERERAQRQAERDYLAAARKAEQAHRAEERAQAAYARAADVERKRLEREARDAHSAAMEADVEERNSRLARITEDLGSLLSATLERDDFVDLNSLRVVVSHPPFDRLDLEQPTPPPALTEDPLQPTLTLPAPPSGLSAVFGKKKHTAAVELARRAHDQAMNAWRAACQTAESQRQAATAARAEAEARRLKLLDEARSRYADECTTRDVEAAEHNQRLDRLIANLGYGVAEAVQEYVSIVLSNSVYPDHFQVAHEFTFDPSSAELELRVQVPSPAEILEVKAYRYAKATDEIVSSALSQKECRDRYAGAVQQVALRSIHEVFEADRRSLIKTISLEVGANAIDPGTGKPVYVPFVFVGAERGSFLDLDLSAVVPSAALARLGASVSKNPYGLMPAVQAGIRRG